MRETIFFSVLLSLMWASAFPMMTIAVIDFTPAAVVVGRLMLGALLLLGYRKWRTGTWLMPMEHWKTYATLGLLATTFPFLGLSYGQQTVPSNISSIIVGSMPIFLTLMGHFMLKDLESFSMRRWLGTFIGFGGVVVLLWPEFRQESLSLDTVLPLLAVTAAPIAYAVVNVIARKSYHIASIDRAVGMAVFGALGSLPFLLFSPVLQEGHMVTWAGVGSIVVLGLFASGIAVPVIFYAIDHIGTITTVFASYLFPIFSMVFGYLLLGETVSETMIYAIVLIMIGMMLGQK